MKRMFQIGLLSAVLAIGSTASNVARAANEDALATGEAIAMANYAESEHIASADYPAQGIVQPADLEVAESASTDAEQGNEGANAGEPAAEYGNAVRQASNGASQDATQQESWADTYTA